jgi:hypothetical protein
MAGSSNESIKEKLPKIEVSIESGNEKLKEYMPTFHVDTVNK